MSKPIPAETRAAFTEFLEDQGDDFFCWGEVVDALDLDATEWDFHARNHAPDDEHDIFDLFGGRVETHGHDDFCRAEPSRAEPSRAELTPGSLL